MQLHDRFRWYVLLIKKGMTFNKPQQVKFSLACYINTVQ
jgi:hypothetical protein